MKQEGNVSRSLVWRILSVLVAMLLTVSGVSSATASGKSSAAFQDGNPQESTVFQIVWNSNKMLFPTNDPFGSTLYDQFSFFSTTLAISQNYDDAHNALDTEVADDFVVPDGDGIWEVDSIDVLGTCHKDTLVFDCGTVSSANVRIYAGGGIVPGNLIYSAESQVVKSADLINVGPLRQYVVDLGNPAFLKPGTYWISIQVNMDYATGDWGWLERTVQNGSWHAFRNPGGGWNEGCYDWCSGHRKWPDLNFRINGNLGGTDKLSVYTGNGSEIYAVVEHGTQPLIYASIPDFSPNFANSVVVINTESGEIEATIPVGFYPTGLAISPDSSKVYVVHRGAVSGIDVIDTITNTVVYSFPITSQLYTYPQDLVYGGPGRLYVLVEGGMIYSFDPSNGMRVSELSAGTGEILAVTQDGNTLCGSLTWSPSNISCYDISTDNPPPAWTNPNVCNNVQTLDISGDGTKVYATCEGDIRIFDLNTLAQTGQFNNGISFETAYGTPDGRFTIGAGSGEPWLMDTQTHSPIRILDNTSIRLLKAGKDSHTIYATDTIPGETYLYTYHFTDFQDIYWKHWARTWIERLYSAGITGGCGTSPLIYCPDASVTRAQMAVFLERGMKGSSFSPPAATGTTFGDVPNDYWSAAWIEQLAADGITGGCSGGNYCPETDVTRAQMAVFLLRAMHGSTYAPPTPTGIFADVPTTHWAAAWIEQLAAEGITSGCGGGNYCPDTPVTRAQMAVFLVKAFNLP